MGGAYLLSQVTGRRHRSLERLTGRLGLSLLRIQRERCAFVSERERERQRGGGGGGGGMWERESGYGCGKEGDVENQSRHSLSLTCDRSTGLFLAFSLSGLDLVLHHEAQIEICIGK